MTADAVRVNEVSSADDPRVADFGVIKDRDALRDRGVFVAEGRLVVERLLAPGCRFRVRTLLLQRERWEGMRGLVEACAARSDPFETLVASKRVMEEIVGFRFHQGCLATGVLAPDPDVGWLLSRAGPGPLVLIEGLVDLDNVGSVFRNGAALGASGVLLSPDCAPPLYRKSIRTSMGHALLLPFARSVDWPGDFARLRAGGYDVLALTPASDARELREVVSTMGRGRRAALLLGAEGAGLTGAAMDASDARVRIPMSAGVDSVNVATAAAIALYEAGMAGRGGGA